MKATAIRKFLSGLNDTNFRYIRIQTSMANDARAMIEEFNLSKERFCELMKIDLDNYQAYLTGGYEYTIENMAINQCAWVELRAEQAKKEYEENFTTLAK